jgi:ribosomal protein S18 acetylase RimI-like enzyme
MVRLRAYRSEDEDSVVTLWWNSWHSIREGLRHPHSFANWCARWASEIAIKQEIVIAENDGVVVGFAAADVAAGVLTQIFVDPTRKRQGVGGELLTWAMKLMPQGFSLHTLVDNTASRAFYERHGLLAGKRGISLINGMATVEYHWPGGARLT